ncbi:Lsr2 family protein [Microbacterium sp. NPDC056569]|uniref:histone-like nucleoid-structuring protein Lsr2 n=1 Tax=Microbacterium sp. NPDC056569 TaxID=3345867 RepID=UPI00366D7686
MARRIVHQLVDDIDGTLLEAGDGETVLFSLDGVAYEIDLTDENAAALRGALERYTKAARTVASGRTTSNTASTGRKRRRSGQQDYSGVREWAKQNGYQVSERGRVPASVLEAYEAAH